jgi:hypothetical protein
MNDLMAHIDRRAELLKRQFDDLDRPVDAGAEAARRAEQYVESWLRVLGDHGRKKGKRVLRVKRDSIAQNHRQELND